MAAADTPAAADRQRDYPSTHAARSRDGRTCCRCCIGIACSTAGAAFHAPQFNARRQTCLTARLKLDTAFDGDPAKATLSAERQCHDTSGKVPCGGGSVAMPAL